MSVYKFATESRVIQYLSIIPDPRKESFNFKHPLISTVFVAIVGGLCGANDWHEVEIVGQSLKDWMQQFVPLPYGIPSHDTFGRLFSMINPKAFNEFLIKWMDLLREKREQDVIAFDGKTLRGTIDGAHGLKALHILNAWSVENGICLGQLKVDDKSNEMKAVPKLIELLDLKGCIVTADALNTQKEIATKIREAGADYVLPVKDNHKDLREDIEIMFQDALQREFRGIDADSYETLEKSHGRIEKRTYHVIDAEDLPNRNLWTGLQSLGMVSRERSINGKTTRETVYYLMSTEIDAKLLERSVRSHWGVETSLHWRLDVILREDYSRYRDRVGAQNLAVIRKITLGVLSKSPLKKKCGIASKRLAAATDPIYREKIIKEFL